MFIALFVQMQIYILVNIKSVSLQTEGLILHIYIFNSIYLLIHQTCWHTTMLHKMKS